MIKQRHIHVTSQHMLLCCLHCQLSCQSPLVQWFSAAFAHQPETSPQTGILNKEECLGIARYYERTLPCFWLSSVVPTYKTSVDKFSATLHEGEALRSLLLRSSLAPLRSGLWAFQGSRRPDDVPCFWSAGNLEFLDNRKRNTRQHSE